MKPIFLFAVTGSFLFAGLLTQHTLAQGRSRPDDVSVAQAPAGKPPEGEKPGPKEGGEGKPGESKPTDGKPTDGKPAGEPGKEGAEKDPNAPAAITKRPAEPPQKPNPDELKVRPDANGRVAFAFRNQPWPQLLEWLAEISGEPLDWQELPGDFVNLASPGAYTVEETRDLFTRHLLARGFTLLRLAGGLAVVKTADLNPAMVPSVDPSELAGLPPYQFARTVFTLEWLSASKMAEEFKPLISSAGKLVALSSTNRIEAMDAVVNLRRISELLADEESADARNGLAREFPLRHIPAANAKKMMEDFLGVGQQSSRSPMDPRQMQQLMQMMQERMGGGGRPDGKPEANKKEPEVAIVANERTNSLIVHAPADRMAIVSEFVKRIDVPSGDMNSLSDVKTRVQTFRLASLGPDKLAEMLQQMNVLEPTTKLTVDEANKALVVYGSAPDRFIIQELIQRLDGSGRKFSVLQLRRLDAREVTESIGFLMGTEENKDDSSSRSRYSYFDFNSRSSDRKKEDKFRVAANVRNRQVLLWANEMELEEVKNLLVKLGELPADGGGGSRIRTIDASNSQETYEYLQRLKSHWQRVSPNPIVLPPADQFEKKNPEAPAVEDQKEKKPSDKPKPAENPAKPAASKDGTVAQSSPKPSQLVAMHAQESSKGSAQPTSEGGVGSAAPPGNGAAPATEDLPPNIQSAEEFDRAFGKPAEVKKPNATSSQEEIRIEVGPDGNLMLYSNDPEALNRLESLMLQTPPPRRPHAVFYVKHSRPSLIVINLEEYFESDDSKKNDSSDRFYRWIFDMPDNKKQDPVGLASGAKLKFLSDNDTGSIIVINADSTQLAIIEDLIKLWDVSEPSRQTSRYTKLIEVKFSKAQTIADTLKEAYRDLLSSNDKTFQGGGQGGDRGKSSGNSGSDLVDTKSGQNSGGTSFSFKGDLSIGVDTVGNTLLISAKGEELLELVSTMIEQLDRAAEPASDVEVVKIQGGTSIEATLRAMLGDRMTTTERRPDDSRDSRSSRDSKSSSSSSRRDGR